MIDLLEDLMLWLGAGIKDERGPDWLFVLAATFAIAKFVLLIGLLVLVSAGFVSGLCTPSWLFDKLHLDSQNNRDKPDAEPPREGRGEPEFEATRGIALSGGGVRAASLSLGVLQGLEGVLETAPAAPMHQPWAPEPSDTDSVDAPGKDRATSRPLSTRTTSGGTTSPGSPLFRRVVHGRRLAVGSQSRGRGHGGGVGDEVRRQARPEETHLLKNLGYLASTFPRGREDEPAWAGQPADDVMGDKLATARRCGSPSPSGSRST